MDVAALLERMAEGLRVNGVLVADVAISEDCYVQVSVTAEGVVRFELVSEKDVVALVDRGVILSEVPRAPALRQPQ